MDRILQDITRSFERLKGYVEEAGMDTAFLTSIQQRYVRTLERIAHLVGEAEKREASRRRAQRTSKGGTKTTRTRKTTRETRKAASAKTSSAKTGQKEKQSRQAKTTRSGRAHARKPSNTRKKPARSK